MKNFQNGAVAPPAIDGDAALPVAEGWSAAPAFDAARYWSYLENLDATDAQKTALLEALWSVMASFVQLGFGVDPVQTVIPALVQRSLDAGAQSSTPAGRPFNDAAAPKENERKEEGDPS